MKTLILLALVLVSASVFEKSSYAYLLDRASCSMSVCDNSNSARDFWVLSTTTFGPLAVLMSGEIDMNSPEARAIVFAQADQVLDGQGDSINPSENVIHAIAQEKSVSDEAVARAVKTIEASGSALTLEAICLALEERK